MAEGRTKWPPVEDDWFVEPMEANRFLLARESFPAPVWDPACGTGNIVKACIAAGYDAFGTDKVERYGVHEEQWWGGRIDFTDPRQICFASPPRSLICNPPYGRAKLAEAFIRRAVALPGVRKVAMFTNAKFLWGTGRGRGLFLELPPQRVYPVNPRPSCPPGEYLHGGGKAAGGVENFAWLIWDLGTITGTTHFIWAPPSAPLETHPKVRF